MDKLKLVKVKLQTKLSSSTHPFSFFFPVHPTPPQAIVFQETPLFLEHWKESRRISRKTSNDKYSDSLLYKPTLPLGLSWWCAVLVLLAHEKLQGGLVQFGSLRLQFGRGNIRAVADRAVPLA